MNERLKLSVAAIFLAGTVASCDSNPFQSLLLAAKQPTSLDASVMVEMGKNQEKAPNFEWDTYKLSDPTIKDHPLKNGTKVLALGYSKKFGRVCVEVPDQEGNFTLDPKNAHIVYVAINEIGGMPEGIRNVVQCNALMVNSGSTR